MTSRSTAISPAMEDYLKAIHQIAEESGGAPVQTQALSDRLAVSTASVTGMMKKLDQYGLVEHEPYRGVVLTPKGEAVALEVLRHHRLLELYLVEQLGMSWEDVHAEADRLEHVISEVLEAVRLGVHVLPRPARSRSARRPRSPSAPDDGNTLRCSRRTLSGGTRRGGGGCGGSARPACRRRRCRRCGRDRVARRTRHRRAV